MLFGSDLVHILFMFMKLKLKLCDEFCQCSSLGDEVRVFIYSGDAFDPKGNYHNWLFESGTTFKL